MMSWDAESKRAWCKANPEKVREYARRYNTKHRKKVRKMHRKYYLKNKEEILEKNRKYRSMHREYYEQYNSYMNARVDANAYFMEYYDHNIILAELDIQCKYRTMIEKKVFE